MKKLIMLLCNCCLVIALFVSCSVQSYCPFYTAETKCDAPKELVGEWKCSNLTNDKKKNDKIRPWVFSNDKVQTYDANNVPSTLNTVFFKVDGELYCDLTAGEPETKGAFNSFWLMQFTPIHTLCKIEINGNRLVCKPLDSKWLSNAIDKKKVSIPRLASKEVKKRMLYTATPEQWQVFLKKYGKTKGVFRDESTFSFVKVPGKLK